MLKKSILCIAGLLLASNIQANELTNYSQISNAINAGEKIDIVVNMGKCTLANGKKVPFNSIGYFQPKAFAIYNNEIATSDLHFTMEDLNAPNQPVYEWLLYKIDQNNVLHLNITLLNATSFSPIGSPMKIVCNIGKSVKLYD